MKEWQGREDNEHLSELLESLDDSAADFPDQVYQVSWRHVTQMCHDALSRRFLRDL